MIRQARQKAIMYRTDSSKGDQASTRNRKENSQMLMQGRKQSQLKVRAPLRVSHHGKREVTSVRKPLSINKISSLIGHIYLSARRRLVADKLIVIDFSEP